MRWLHLQQVEQMAGAPIGLTDIPHIGSVLIHWPLPENGNIGFSAVSAVLGEIRNEINASVRVAMVTGLMPKSGPSS